MVVNLTETIQISKHIGHGEDAWMCYEPLENDGSQKKPLWKRVTGMMPSDAMYSWLQAHQADNGQAAELFRELAGLH